MSTTETDTIVMTEEEIAVREPKKVLYTAKTHATGGRDGGSSLSPDGRLDVHLSIPGGPDHGTNPEQLFAAGWSSCLISAMKIAATRMKVKFPPDHTIDTEVDLCLDRHDRHFLRARFNISLPGVEPGVAQAIVNAADQLCPYSRVTRGNISAQVSLV